MTAVSSRIAAALPSNGRMRNTFMERSSSKGSLNGIRSARAHVAAPAERRGETVEQASGRPAPTAYRRLQLHRDRKSTRLNSSHLVISYAVFCLKKKKKKIQHKYETKRIAVIM